MKKPVLALVLALALGLVLTGCGAQKKAQGYTVEDAQVLLDSGVFNGDMAQISGDMVALLYGIDGETVTDCVSYQAVNTSVSADELTILVLTDEEAAQAAEAACERRLDAQLEQCRDYTPAAVPRLENAVVRRMGNTVLLAVGDPNTLSAAVDQLEG